MEAKNGKSIGRSIVKRLGLRIIDIYVIRKFLSTFFYSIILIISIAVIFDFSEKIDDFIENKAPIREVFLSYYLNFIPYFAVLFSSLFTFISVIYFTSKMASNTEIIAILSHGMSLSRLLRPYIISAAIIAALSFLMSNYVIPEANRKRLDFEEKYVHKRPVSFDRRNIHRQIEPGIFIYFESFSNWTMTGYNFSIEKFEDGELVSKLISDQITWDSIAKKWNIYRYYIRDYDGLNETITEGPRIDTVLNMHPTQFMRRPNIVEAMRISELNDFINEARMQGETNITIYELEKYKRVAFPFATIILTVMGMTVSCRKVRGGVGLHLGAGLGLSFAYILFMQFSSQFAIGGSLPPMLAAWLPNIIFSAVAFGLYYTAPK